MKIQHALAVLFSALLCSCASNSDLVAMTSGVIGCPKSETVVKDTETGWTTFSWVATCRGQTFYCTSFEGGAYTCAKEIAPTKS
ncbi:hypothetical protein [Pseudomonas sp.]|uniref:hypothetical protein n=1 Tax=Pseudomonas sp. TaxID=306 RepID=UPI003D6FBA50